MAGFGSEGRLNNRGIITGEGLTVLRNSVVGTNKRARNRIQQQLSQVH